MLNAHISPRPRVMDCRFGNEKGAEQQNWHFQKTKIDLRLLLEVGKKKIKLMWDEDTSIIGIASQEMMIGVARTSFFLTNKCSNDYAVVQVQARKFRINFVYRLSISLWRGYA